MNQHDKIVHEYPPEYCRMLELAYGDGLMSEGGTEAIDHLFDGINLKGKRILDIGCGLGGAMLHIAKKYPCDIVGIEINRWMIELCRKNALENTKFVLLNDPSTLPFNDQSFDIIYSKGVLVHSEDKLLIFKEIRRCLSPQGLCIINDWLSSQDGIWCDEIQRLCNLEDLSLFPTSQESYENLLSHAGLNVLKTTNNTHDYAGYNNAVAKNLQLNAKRFISEFSETLLQESIEGYQLIAQAMLDEGLLVKTFVSKPAI